MEMYEIIELGVMITTCIMFASFALSAMHLVGCYVAIMYEEKNDSVAIKLLKKGMNYLLITGVLMSIICVTINYIGL